MTVTFETGNLKRLRGHRGTSVLPPDPRSGRRRTRARPCTAKSVGSCRVLSGPRILKGTSVRPSDAKEAGKMKKEETFNNQSRSGGTQRPWGAGEKCLCKVLVINGHEASLDQKALWYWRTAIRLRQGFNATGRAQRDFAAGRHAERWSALRFHWFPPVSTDIHWFPHTF